VLIWFAGASSGPKFAVMAVNIAVCHGWAISAPAGTRTRPIARLKPAKVVTPGSTANSTIAAKTAVRPVWRCRPFLDDLADR
jgi:hypothetical protein